MKYATKEQEIAKLQKMENDKLVRYWEIQPSIKWLE